MTLHFLIHTSMHSGTHYRVSCTGPQNIFEILDIENLAILKKKLMFKLDEQCMFVKLLTFGFTELHGLVFLDDR